MLTCKFHKNNKATYYLSVWMDLDGEDGPGKIPICNDCAILYNADDEWFYDMLWQNNYSLWGAVPLDKIE